MKACFLALLVFPILLMSCRQEVTLKDKFPGSSSYDVELVHVNAAAGTENTIELRNRRGNVLADPVRIDRSFKPEECEYFLDEVEGEKFVDIYVMTGGRHWRWRTTDHKNWAFDWTEDLPNAEAGP